MKDKAIESLVNTLNNGAKNIPKVTETMIHQYQQQQLFYGIASFTIAVLLIIATVWVWTRIFGKYEQYKRIRKSGTLETTFSDFVIMNDLETAIKILIIGTLVAVVGAISFLTGGCDNIGNYISPISGFVKDVLNN